MFSQAFAGDVECRPMIDGGANKWQAQRDVDRLAKRKTFNGNHCLIVITGDHGVEFTARSPQKHRVCRKRTVHINIVHTMASFDRWNNLRRLLHAEQATLGSMRVQSGDGDAGTLYPPTSKFTTCKVDRSNNSITLNHSDRFQEWNMCG